MYATSPAIFRRHSVAVKKTVGLRWYKWTMLFLTAKYFWPPLWAESTVPPEIPFIRITSELYFISIVLIVSARNQSGSWSVGRIGVGGAPVFNTALSFRSLPALSTRIFGSSAGFFLSLESISPASWSLFLFTPWPALSSSLLSAISRVTSWAVSIRIPQGLLANTSTALNLLFVLLWLNWLSLSCTDGGGKSCNILSVTETAWTTKLFCWIPFCCCLLKPFCLRSMPRFFPRLFPLVPNPVLSGSAMPS